MKKIILYLFFSLTLTACATNQPAENLAAAGYNVQLGLGYLAQGDRARAKEKLLRAVDLAPDAVDPYLALAYYYQKTAHLKAADIAYQQALAIAPDAGASNNNYAAFLCANGDYQQALKYFQYAIDDVYYTQTASAYENAALCAAQIPDMNAAQTYATLALQQDPMRAHVWLKLSTLMAQQDDPTQALEFLARYHALSQPTARSRAFGEELQSMVYSATSS